MRWISFWAKPSGRKIKTKTSEGIEIEIPIQIEGGKLGTMKRLNIDPSKTVMPVPKVEELTEKEADEMNINLNLGDLTSEKLDVLRRLATK